MAKSFKIQQPKIPHSLPEEIPQLTEEDPFYSGCLIKDCSISEETINRLSFDQIVFKNVIFEDVSFANIQLTDVI